MIPKKTTDGRKKGFRKVQVSFRPEQVKELVHRARARADEVGRVRADVGEIVREAVDAWIAKRPR